MANLDPNLDNIPPLKPDRQTEEISTETPQKIETETDIDFGFGTILFVIIFSIGIIWAIRRFILLRD